MTDFWTALNALDVHFNGHVAPKNAYRIKLRDYADTSKVTSLVSAYGGTYTIRDGMANGPVVTFRFKGGK